jgi:MarR family transcriptional regulator, organic hydroperoxide resistance regulator
MKRTTKLAEMAERIERDVREIREKLRRPFLAEVERARLTGPQVGVMRAVFRSGGISVKQIGERTGLAHSTVSGIVDRLAARGMLQRQTSQSDGRVSRITVTKAVRDFMAKQAPGLMARPLARALARATPAERKAILKGLDTLRCVAGLDPARRQ